MATKEEVIAAAGEPKLPGGFIIDPFTNSRGQSLFTIHLPRKDTDSPPKAVLLLIHGLFDHCCRAGYLRLYQYLSEAGVDVFALDVHGHGRSDGEPRHYVENFDHYVDEVIEFVERSKKKYTDKSESVPPIILTGHSMGGLISVLTTLRLGSDQITGIIMTGPALGLEMGLVVKLQKFLAPIIDTLMPKARIVGKLRPEELSRNKEAVQGFVNDPLCGKGGAVARTAFEVMRKFEVVSEHRGEITCPILIFHGTDDKITSPKASKDFFENVGTPRDKKRLFQLPGLYHNLLDEPEADQLLNIIKTFAESGGSEFAKVEGEDDNGVITVIFQPLSS